MYQTAIYLFRQDLRLEDNPSFTNACNNSQNILPVFCHSIEEQSSTAWGFQRRDWHRSIFLNDTLDDLSKQLKQSGSDLLILQGTLVPAMQELIRKIGAEAIYCEEIAAPEEQDQVNQLKDLGVQVHTHWQSSMIDLQDLPFEPADMPEQFTQFRQKIEAEKYLFTEPLPTPSHIPKLPQNSPELFKTHSWQDKETLDKKNQLQTQTQNTPSSFPYWKDPFKGGQTSALQHLDQYFSRQLPHTYKKTRNELFGEDYSSKFSPWLANGSLSARVAAAQLQQFESKYGTSDGSYWLWFELLWRDYFRILHLKWGKKLYRARGLGQMQRPMHDQASFLKWCSGHTGESIVDAGMKELVATGYLSNRLRQVVASYLIYDLNGDWRAGAAWFESQLIDYDVYSNQGNWLYIAGRGTDPRGGRRFNPKKQALDHDPNRAYQSIWLGH